MSSLCPPGWSHSTGFWVGYEAYGQTGGGPQRSEFVAPQVVETPIVYVRPIQPLACVQIFIAEASNIAPRVSEGQGEGITPGTATRRFVPFYSQLHRL